MNTENGSGFEIFLHTGVFARVRKTPWGTPDHIKQCFCAKGHSPGWAGMDLSRGIKPRPAMKPPKRVRTAYQLSRGFTHRRDRYRDPAFEVKLCAACRTQQVVYKSSRSKRRGARCIGDRAVGVLPNGSMHQDVPASTVWWCSSQLVACAQQAVHRYCLNLRPSGAECPHTRNPVGHAQEWPVPALS